MRTKLVHTYTLEVNLGELWPGHHMDDDTQYEWMAAILEILADAQLVPVCAGGNSVKQQVLLTYRSDGPIGDVERALAPLLDTAVKVNNMAVKLRGMRSHQRPV